MTVGSTRPRQTDNPKTNSEFSVEHEYVYNRSGPVRWIVSHVLRYKLFLGMFLLAVTLTNVLFSAVPRLTGLAFDVVLQPDPSAQRLFTIAAIILGAVLIRGIIDLVNSFSIETLGQRLERDTREELYLSLLGKSQTFHNRQRVGDIMARATGDVRQLNPMMNPGVALISESVVATVVPLIFIAFIDLRLLIAPVAFVVVFVFALRDYMRRLNPVSGAMRRRFGVMNAGLNETITGIEVVKSVVQEAQEKRKFVLPTRQTTATPSSRRAGCRRAICRFCCSVSR